MAKFVYLKTGVIFGGGGGSYTTILIVFLLMLNANSPSHYANGIKIDEPEPQLQQSPRDTTNSVNSDRINLNDVNFSNQSSSSNSLINSFTTKQTKHDENDDDGGERRIRRNSSPLGGIAAAASSGRLLGNNNINFSPAATTTNLEGLLASCQLTNLLLYQLVNQQQQKAALSPAAGLFASPSSPFMSPFNPFLQPAAVGVGPFLTTYTTTSTYTTKMTSTDVITIPLLFGNKPSPTTITRTKTYDVTTSTELTLTSTILPTTTTTTIIKVVPTADVGLAPTKASKYGAETEVEPSELSDHYETPILNALNNDEVTTATSSPPRSKKKSKRKNRPSSSTQQKQSRHLLYHGLEQQQEELDPRDTSPAYKFGGRQKHQQPFKLTSPARVSSPPKFRRQYIYEDGTTHLENPDYYIADYYPSEVLHQNQQRLKRRGEVDSIHEESNLDEVILEPSFDSSSNIQLAEECPAVTTTTVTVTSTTTKTVTKTKLVNPATALSGLVIPSDVHAYNSPQNSNNINYEATHRAKKHFVPIRSNDRRSININSGSGSNNNGGSGGSGGFGRKGRGTTSTTTTSTERSRGISSKERRRGSSHHHRQRSTTPDSLSSAPSTNNYYSNNFRTTTNDNGGDINSRRSRSRFHANYYAGRTSY